MMHWLLNRLNQQFTLPSYVKQAEVSTLQGDSDNKKIYADTENKEYPYHTKAACWVSVVSYLMDATTDTHKVNKDVEQRLLKAAKAWNIMPDLQDVLPTIKKMADASYRGMDKSAYALPDLPAFPVWDADAVKKSAETFATNRKLYPYELRKTAARNILSKAAAFNVELKPEHKQVLNKSAGYGLAAANTIKAAIDIRQRMLRRFGYVEESAKLQQLKNSWTAQPDILTSQKVASCLSEIDERTELYKKYAQGLELPEDCCCAVTADDLRKAASAYVKLPNGMIYTRSDLQANADVIKTVLDTSDDPIKAAACAEPLTCDALFDVLARRGVAPVTPPAPLLNTIGA